MKKVLTFLCLFLAISFPAIGEDFDYSSATSEKLAQIINDAHNELLLRSVHDDPNKQFLINSEDFKVYITNKEVVDDQQYKHVTIDGVYINDTDSYLDAIFGVKINGWKVYPNAVIFDAAPKAKGHIYLLIYYDDAEIDSAEGIEVLELSPSMDDPNNRDKSLFFDKVVLKYENGKFLVVQ